MVVLVDADNVSSARLRPVLQVLVASGRPFRLIASGHPAALARVSWPTGSQLLPAQGWQRADMQLADRYEPGPFPLLLVSGDGDFALLAARHPGPVLVVSGAPSTRLREVASVVDPVTDGTRPVADWLTSADDDHRCSTRTADRQS